MITFNNKIVKLANLYSENFILQKSIQEFVTKRASLFRICNFFKFSILIENFKKKPFSDCLCRYYLADMQHLVYLQI